MILKGNMTAKDLRLFNFTRYETHRHISEIHLILLLLAVGDGHHGQRENNSALPTENILFLYYRDDIKKDEPLVAFKPVCNLKRTKYKK